jgi:type I restriction enzyme, S subunit
MKDSGVPWIGKIPENWGVWRIGRLGRVGNGSTPSRANSAYWNGGTYPWLNSSQVNRGYINSADQFVTQIALRECHLPKVPIGSILVAITGQGKTRGLSAVLGIESTINQHIAFITPRTEIVLQDFMHYALSAAYSQLRALSEDSGSTKGAITCEDLKRFKIAVPAKSIQASIVNTISEETRSISLTISLLERENSFLLEYRSRLTSDIVTGKLDVRSAVAQLPDEIPSDAPEIADSTDDEIPSDEENAE